jgi:hypothetical protein
MPLGPRSVLAPGARGIFVRNLRAFSLRYATGLTVLGEYRDKLSNAGEELTLVAADGGLIFDIPWDDGEGWPQEADGPGFSLVRNATAGAASDPQGWRRSLDPSGESWRTEPLTFAAWQAIYFPAGGPAAAALADPDFDGLSNAAEFAAATHPGWAKDAALPVTRRAVEGGQPAVEISMRQRPGGPSWTLESAADFEQWVAETAAPSVSPNADGSETVTWRPLETFPRGGYRAKTVIP